MDFRKLGNSLLSGLSLFSVMGTPTPARAAPPEVDPASETGSRDRVLDSVEARASGLTGEAEAVYAGGDAPIDASLAVVLPKGEATDVIDTRALYRDAGAREARRNAMQPVSAQIVTFTLAGAAISRGPTGERHAMILSGTGSIFWVDVNPYSDSYGKADLYRSLGESTRLEGADRIAFRAEVDRLVRRATDTDRRWRPALEAALAALDACRE